MALDKFAHPDREFTGHRHNHDSWHGNQRRIESANNQVREYVLFDAKRQRVAGNENGHHIGNQPLGRVEGDQWTPADWEAIQEIRAELKGMCE